MIYFKAILSFASLGMNERSGKLAAVKQLSIVNGTNTEIDTLKREISVMWQLDHEHIVRYEILKSLFNKENRTLRSDLRTKYFHVIIDMSVHLNRINTYLSY